MQINITARKFTLNDDIRDYVEKEVSSLSKFYEGVIEADVVLGWEKRMRFVEVTLNANGTVFIGKDSSENMKKSIDRAVEKLERQLKKFKEKKKNKRVEKLV
ncbi:ribosome-associated translation inhibitor RaiA [candidate division KSB1 bacterium]|nr:MAG: ribosome-associated translation inhibitor RaiA [candidate division KSB1 bacterium]